MKIVMQSYRRGSFPCAVEEVGSTAPSTGSNFFQCQRSKEWKCVATISKLGVYSTWNSGQRRASGKTPSGNNCDKRHKFCMQTLRKDVSSPDQI